MSDGSGRFLLIWFYCILLLFFIPILVGIVFWLLIGNLFFGFGTILLTYLLEWYLMWRRNQKGSI